MARAASEAALVQSILTATDSFGRAQVIDHHRSFVTSSAQPATVTTAGSMRVQGAQSPTHADIIFAEVQSAVSSTLCGSVPR